MLLPSSAASTTKGRLLLMTLEVPEPIETLNFWIFSLTWYIRPGFADSNAGGILGSAIRADIMTRAMMDCIADDRLGFRNKCAVTEKWLKQIHPRMIIGLLTIYWSQQDLAFFICSTDDFTGYIENFFSFIVPWPFFTLLIFVRGWLGTAGGVAWGRWENGRYRWYNRFSQKGWKKGWVQRTTISQ